MPRIRSLLFAAAVLLTGAVGLQVSYGTANWLSGLMTIAALSCAAVLAVETIMRGLGTSPAIRVRVRLLVVTTALALAGCELFLRFATTQFMSYTELNGGRYFSGRTPEPTWFHVYEPGRPRREVRPEFIHERTINSLGLTFGDPPLEKAPGEYRILALGDSFTEGIGVSADLTWVAVMQQVLAERYPKSRVTALNAGVSGSDPSFEYILLKEKLLPFHPDLVIVATNNSDINDMMIRGGSERFQPDGTVRFRPAPWWEPLYAASFLTRAVVRSVLGYNQLLIKASEAPSEGLAAGHRVRAALDDIRELCDATGIALLVAAHPSPLEIARGAYLPAFAQVVSGLELDSDIHVADLLRSFERDGRITPDNARTFFWPIDMHHNAEGYRVMGETIARHVMELGFLEGRSDP